LVDAHGDTETWFWGVSFDLIVDTVGQTGAGFF
jgi:hypothetical protein